MAGALTCDRSLTRRSRCRRPVWDFSELDSNSISLKARTDDLGFPDPAWLAVAPHSPISSHNFH
jgi:hypothetical protein